MRLADTLNNSLQTPVDFAHGPVVPLRQIRSFVRRESRMTHAQQRALTDYWATFGVDAAAGLLNLEALFGRSASRTLEIGFGNGESLATMAAAHPDEDYLGIEVHRPGVGHLLLRATALQLTNLRVLCTDAVEALDRQIPDDAFDRIDIDLTIIQPNIHEYRDQPSMNDRGHVGGKGKHRSDNFRSFGQAEKPDRHHQRRTA